MGQGMINDELTENYFGQDFFDTRPNGETRSGTNGRFRNGLAMRDNFISLVIFSRTISGLSSADFKFLASFALCGPSYIKNPLSKNWVSALS